MHGHVLIVEIGNNHLKCIESLKNLLNCSDSFVPDAEKAFSILRSSSISLAVKMLLGLRKKEGQATLLTSRRISKCCKLNNSKEDKHYRISLWRMLSKLLSLSLQMEPKEKRIMIRLILVML